MNRGEIRQLIQRVIEQAGFTSIEVVGQEALDLTLINPNGRAVGSIRVPEIAFDNSESYFKARIAEQLDAAAREPLNREP